MPSTVRSRRTNWQFGRNRLLSAIMIGVLAGCADPSGPTSSAVIRVEADTVRALQRQAGTVEWVSFVVPVTIKNTGSTSIFSDLCFYGVDQLVGVDDWRPVWSPICAAGFSNGVEVRAGEQLTVDLRVDASTAGPGEPQWGSNALAGTHRVTVWLVTGRAGSPMVSVVSDAFSLAVQKVP